MIGFVHHVLFEFLQKEFGDDKLAEIKSRAGLSSEQEFRFDKVYSNQEWQRILSCVLETTGLSTEEAENAFGDYCAVEFPKKFPGFLKGVTSAREHLLRQPTIHNTMSAALSEQDRENVQNKFRVEDLQDELVVHYQSENHHCTLYKRIAQRVFEMYNENGEIWETMCMKKGDAKCEIHVRFFGKRS